MLTELYKKIIRAFTLDVDKDNYVVIADDVKMEVSGKPVMVLKANELPKHFINGEYDIVPFNPLKENALKGINPITKKLLGILNSLQEDTVREAMRECLVAIYEKRTIYDVQLIQLLNTLTATSGKAKTVVDDETISVFDNIILSDPTKINNFSLRHNRKVVDNTLMHSVIVNRSNGSDYWVDKIKNAGMRKRDERLFIELIKQFTFDKNFAYTRDDTSSDLIAVLKACLTLNDKLGMFKNFSKYVLKSNMELQWSDLVDLHIYAKEANMLPEVNETTNASKETQVEVVDETPTLSEIMNKKAPAGNPTGTKNSRLRELELEIELEKLKTSQPQNNILQQPVNSFQQIMQPNVIPTYNVKANMAPWDEPSDTLPF